MPERTINGITVNLSDRQTSIVDHLDENPEGVSLRDLLLFVCSFQSKQILQSNLTVSLARLSKLLEQNGLVDVLQITKADPDLPNSKIVNIKLNKNSDNNSPR